MNLADLTSYICTKGQMVGTADVAAAKLFLAKRYELIWNSYLWKDSLVTAEVTVSPDDPNHAEGIVLVPNIIERVVAVRSADRSVRVVGMETFYREDFDKFAGQGSPYEFALMSPIWFVWRGYGGLQLACEAPALVKWRDPQGSAHSEQLESGALLAPKTVYDDQIILSGAGYTAVNGTYQIAGAFHGLPAWKLMDGDAADLVFFGGGSQGWRVDSLIGGGMVYYSGPTTVDHPGKVTAWNLYHAGTLPAPTVFPDTTVTKQRIEVESMSKPVGTTEFSLNGQFNWLGEQNGGTLSASDTRSPQYQRIRLFYIPKSETTLRILGKRKCSALTFDQEEPEIRNIDNCLIAFALGDLWARRRQLGKANIFYQEGAALLHELAKLETVQAANNSRFIPDAGAGDPFFGPGRSPGFWV